MPVGLAGKFQNVLLAFNPTESRYWVVGTYPVLCELSKELRSNDELRQLLFDKGIQFGFRETDKPPTGLIRQKEYGMLEARLAGDFIKSRKIETHTPVTKDKVCGSRIAARKNPGQSSPARCSVDRPPSLSYMRNFPRAVGHQTSHPGLANAKLANMSYGR